MVDTLSVNDTIIEALCMATSALPLRRPLNVQQPPATDNPEKTKASTGIPQPRRNPINSEMNPAPKAHILIPCAMPLEQFHLQVIQRIEIRKAVLNRPSEQRIVSKTLSLASNLGKHVRSPLILSDDLVEHDLAQLLVGHELRNRDATTRSVLASTMSIFDSRFLKNGQVLCILRRSPSRLPHSASEAAPSR